MQSVVIGTAGHIDHGKTQLVKRLTGIDTARLPEEKRRGISIDLGFAHWESGGMRFGIVDVPGHERFVHTMVAGASAIDLALLVIAADDGVMPQTREHLDILHLLGVRAGVIAITKSDLVEPELIELVREEIAELIADSALREAPVVAVSSHTGAGSDELERALRETAASLSPPSRGEFFRMPIDRVFSVPGHGTVVTGTVLSGRIQTGDAVQLWPDGRLLRVRGVQSHHQSRSEGAAHQRTALNLAGIKTEEIRRGDELAAPHTLQATRRLMVDLRALAGSPLILKDRISLQLHLGTSATECRVMLKGKLLGPGERGFAELRLQTPIVAEYGQRFILRRRSPSLTVAGGTVLDPGLEDRQRIRDLETRGMAWSATDPQARLSTLWAASTGSQITPEIAAWRMGIRVAEFPQLMEQLQASGELIRIGDREGAGWIHRNRLATLSDAVLRRIREEIERQQPCRSLPKPAIVNLCRGLCEGPLLERILSQLLREQRLASVGDQLGPAEMQVQLTKNQALAQATMLTAIAAAGLAPPTLKEFAKSLQQKPEALEMLLGLAVQEGRLVRISEELFLTPAALEQARGICRDLFQQQPTATVSQLREAWGVTRKYAFPLCEFFDARRLTVREGDLRRAGPELA